MTPDRNSYRYTKKRIDQVNNHENSTNSKPKPITNHNINLISRHKNIRSVIYIITHSRSDWLD